MRAPAGGGSATAPRSARAAGARWRPVATERKRAASESEKRLRLHQLGTEGLGELDQPVVSDGMPQLDASWLPGKGNDLDSTKSDSVRPWLLDHDLLDLVFGHVEVFHPIQLLD